MSSLNTQDPTVAVIIERLSRMAEDARRDREETKAELAALRDEIKANKQTTDTQLATLTGYVTSARAGWWVLTLIGTLLLSALGVVATVSKIWPWQ